MRKSFVIHFGSLLIICLIWVTAPSAYEEMEVTNGGIISGTVKLDGPIPTPKKLKVDVDQKVCGVEKASEELIVSKENGIKNVVVSIANIEKGKPLEIPKTHPEMDQKGCQFSPHVMIIPEGTTLDVLNPDGIFHNFQATSFDTFINKGMRPDQTRLSVTFDLSDTLEVSCEAHAWMRAWMVVTEHPYYALTDSNGRFKLSDVPPGTYELKFWHEALGEQTKEVTVKAKGETEVNTEYEIK